MDRVAEKVVQKYPTSNCAKLRRSHAQPKPAQRAEMEERVVQMLRNDPQMGKAFFDRISAPIVNKMFECGMIH